MAMGMRKTPGLAFSLDEEGMGPLENAGLVGLAMALAAVREDTGPAARELCGALSWEISERGVSLSFRRGEGPAQALRGLVRHAWQILDGVYFLPALHQGPDAEAHAFRRAHVHNGLLGTFLQSGRAYSPRVGPPEPLAAGPDEDRKAVWVRRALPGEVPRQWGFLDRKILAGGGGWDKELIGLPGWLHPGAARRFGPKDPGFCAPRRMALLLVFAPLGCLYLELPREEAKKRMRPSWALVAAHVTNLPLAAGRMAILQAELARRFDQARVAGLADAGLSFGLAYGSRPLEKRLEAPLVRVTAMGVTDHFSSLPQVADAVVKDRWAFRPSATAIARYAAVARALASRDGGPPRARVAGNVAAGRPWYADLAVPLPWQREELPDRAAGRRGSGVARKRWFDRLRKSRRELMELTREDGLWDHPGEQAFLDVLRAALRRLLDREESALSRGGSRRLSERWEARTERVRRSLTHAKTRTLARKTLMELLAEAGGGRELTENRAQVWRMVNDPHDWQKALDLALLALITFTDARLARERPRGGEGGP